MNNKIEVNEDQLKALTVKLCELGESMGLEPYEFSIMLSMIARHLCESQGIEVHSERKMDG